MHHDVQRGGVVDVGVVCNLVFVVGGGGVGVGVGVGVVVVCGDVYIVVVDDNIAALLFVIVRVAKAASPTKWWT